MSTLLKKNRCQDWKLYAITCPERLAGRALEDVVEQAILGGAGAVQLRDKRASNEELIAQVKRLLPVTRAHGVPLIVNDRAFVVLKTGADGLHLGQDDGPLEAARALLGGLVILGRSTHSPEQALAAEREGFDYIGVGPVFGTPTKPAVEPVGLALIEFAAKNVRIPFVAIGGIDGTNLGRVLASGARAVAVVRAVMGEPDPRGAAQELLAIIKRKGAA